MKYCIILIFILIQLACNNKAGINIEEYHHLTNQAELSICYGNYKKASIEYESAFKYISKPFGADVFNAALVNQLIHNIDLRDQYLMILINNLDDQIKVIETFVGNYISKDSFDLLMSKRKIKYNVRLKNEFKEIEKRDQLFRPMYDTHYDTINANRIINMNRITSLTDSIGFPSHIELGYTANLVAQKHDIVLLHTAQTRSRDKTIIDLEPLLYNAVTEGRLDPVRAIFYLSMQNDLDKESFVVYAADQLKHHLLPDSLNSKIWVPDLDSAQTSNANKTRNKWYADLLDDITLKRNFKNRTSMPFIFTSVRTTMGYLPSHLNQEEALEQYKLGTSWMKQINDVE